MKSNDNSRAEHSSRADADADTVANVDGGRQSPQPLLPPNDSRATVAMSSPVIATNNRFAALRSSDDNYYCDNDGVDGVDRQFQEVRSRQSAKRMRQGSADQQQQQQQLSQSRQQDVGEQQAGRQTRHRNGRLLSGASRSRGLAAAKKIVKKKVFCIDNVNITFSPDDVQRYVSSLAVNVLSCFPAKPRRLCIDANDQDKLLDPAKLWPDSITIAEWYHLPPSAGIQHGDTDGETGNAVGGVSLEARDSVVSDVAVAAAVHDNEATEDMESDDTVLEINLDAGIPTHHGV